MQSDIASLCNTNYYHNFDVKNLLLFLFKNWFLSSHLYCKVEHELEHLRSLFLEIDSFLVSGDLGRLAVGGVYGLPKGNA